MTRPADVEAAAELGASYVGVVFAPSGRQLTPLRAAEVLAPLRGGGVRAVGVFAHEPRREILAAADNSGLQVLQLHGARYPEEVTDIASHFTGEVWVVLRVGAAGLGEAERRWVGAVQGVVLDTLSPRGLGGTGETFDWGAAREAAQELRADTRLIVAGGLHAGNVAAVRQALDPDVLDVSSGIESAIGIKDRERMRAFMVAARADLHR